MRGHLADAAAPTAADQLADAIRAVVVQAVEEALTRAGIGQTADTAEMVSIPEAARRIGIGSTTVKGLIAAGQLPSRQINRRRLVAVSDIAEYVANLGSGAA